MLTLNTFAAEIPTVTFSGTETLTMTNVRDALEAHGGYLTAEVNVAIEGYTTIEHNAFRDCSALTSITISNSVTSIGYGAFRDCSALTSITIPNSVTRLESDTFMGCSALTSITIPNSVTKIKGSVFRECTALTSIIIPNSVTTIELATFYNCTALTSITIPNSVTTIGSKAFSNCTALTSITIPNSVTYISYDTFSDWTAQQTIYMEHTYTSILGDSLPAESKIIWGYKYPADEPYIITFDGTGTLTKEIVDEMLAPYVDADVDIIIKGYDKIGLEAFEKERTNIKHITLTNSVQHINNKAFGGCTSWSNIVIPKSVIAIAEDPFGNHRGGYGAYWANIIYFEHAGPEEISWQRGSIDWTFQPTVQIVWGYKAPILGEKESTTPLNLNLRKTIIDVSQPTFLSLVINPNTAGLEVISDDYYIQSNTNCKINVELTAFKLSDADESGYSIVAPDTQTWESLPMSQKLLAVGIQHSNASELSNGVSLTTPTLWSTELTEPTELCTIAANKRATFEIIAQHGYSVNEPRSVQLELVPRIYAA